MRAPLLFLLAFQAVAATLPQFSVEQLTARSDLIVRGRITRAWAAMDSEDRFVWTHYQLQVSATLKGSARSIVEICEPGGTLHGVSYQMSGSTPYAVGEDVAVFLYRTPIGYLRTTNYGQGKLLVSPDGRVHLNRAFRLAGAVFLPTAHSAPGTSTETLDAIPFADFQSRIAGIVSPRREVRK